MFFLTCLYLLVLFIAVSKCSSSCEWYYSIRYTNVITIHYESSRTCFNNQFCCGDCFERYCCNDSLKMLEQSKCSDDFCGWFNHKHYVNNLTKCNDNHTCSGSCTRPECVPTNGSNVKKRLNVDQCLSQLRSFDFEYARRMRLVWGLILCFIGIFIIVIVILSFEIGPNSSFTTLNRRQAVQSNNNYLEQIGCQESQNNEGLPSYESAISNKLS